MIHVLLAEDEIALAKIIKDSLESRRKFQITIAANGSNPISIVVPCHRVIGRNGTMTGYAGGVQRKEWLLRHEGYLLL